MQTIQFNDFIPQVIDQDTELKANLFDIIESGEDEIRIRDHKDAVFILG